MKFKKEEIFFLVFNEVLKLEIEKGHLKWSLSAISRNTNVTRTLIYYYFGNDREKLLLEAMKFMAKKIWSLDYFDHRKRIIDRLDGVLELSKKYPYLFLHYYMNRTNPNEMGQIIRESEKQFLINLGREFPVLNKNEIFMIYLLELGAISYQSLTRKQLLWVQKFLFTLYRKTKATKNNK